MILRKGIKALPKATTVVKEVERKSPPKAVQQPVTKSPKAVTKVGSLSDLAKIPEFASQKRHIAVIKDIDYNGNLILGNTYTLPTLENGNKSLKRMTIPFTTVPAGMLAGACTGRIVSYSLVEEKDEKGFTRKKACDFALEKDLYTGLGLVDFTRECNMCINVSQAEMLAVTNGIRKTREFFDMNATEKQEFVRDALFSMLGENVTTVVVKNVLYYSIPVADLSTTARVLFSDKIAANTASATSASTTATNNVATTATTLTTATDNNTTASTTVNAATAA